MAGTGSKVQVPGASDGFESLWSLDNEVASHRETEGETGMQNAVGMRPRIRAMTMWPSVRRLNLLYHVCPLKKNDVWRANVRQIVRRSNIFNGRKVIAVVRGNGLHGLDVVRHAMGDDAVEYLELPNDEQLRETATFLPLLESIESTDPEEASFFAHTKGNSTRNNALGVELWRNAMYHHLLEGVNVCRDLLATHPCVGTHKTQWPADESPYPTSVSNRYRWMFSGTFFWFRHVEVFSRCNWSEVKQDRYGAEAWLGHMFRPEQGATVFQPWPATEYPIPSPYDPRLYLWPIRDVP